MRSTSSFGLLTLLLLATPACGLVSVPRHDASHEAGPASDASVPDGAPDAAAPEAATPALCEGLAELASAANLQPNGSYELVSTATEGRWNTSCTAQAWEQGRDTAVRFTAPSAGRWLFTSVGGSLWSFSGASVCDPRAVVSRFRCQEFTAYHDTDHPFATPLHFTARLAQGEALYLVSDGCQGTACSFRVHAEPIPDRGCYDADTTCPEGQLCRGANADNSVGACIPGTAPSLSNAALYASERGAELRGQAFDAERDAAQLVFELYDAAGRLVPFQGHGQNVVDVYTDSNGPLRAMLSHAALPAGVLTARVWLRDSVGLESAPQSLPLRAPPTLGPGQPCDVERIANLCVAEAHCVSPDGSWDGVCTIEHPAQLLSASATNDAATDQFFLHLEGTDPDVVATNVELVFLDAAGEPATEPLRTGCTLQPASGSTAFTGDLGLRYSALGSGLRSVRVTLEDVYGLRSNTVEAPMP